MIFDPQLASKSTNKVCVEPVRALWRPKVPSVH